MNAQSAMTQLNPNGRYSPEQRQAFADEARTSGFCILPAHFDIARLQAWQQAFNTLLQTRIADGTASARGPARYYISLPFTAPFADPAIYEDPDILDIISQLAEEEIVMPELATDTPLVGSDYQVIHRDFPLRSPDMPDIPEERPFQFAVNFPLVEITLENGPFEIAPGTHILADDAASEQVKSGQAEAALIPLQMALGDVMIRDVRALHRGTPNRTEAPRPMVVVGYNSKRHQRPQLRIQIPEAEFASLTEHGKQLLQLNPIVKSLEDTGPAELYSNLSFL